MADKKKTPARKTSTATVPRPESWQDAIRLYLAKVPAVDAVFVNTASGTVHVYSIVERFQESTYKGLLRQEDRIEKAFPEISFEFHTRVHQGRKPTESGPWGSELVYLR